MSNQWIAISNLVCNRQTINIPENENEMPFSLRVNTDNGFILDLYTLQLIAMSKCLALMPDQHHGAPQNQSLVEVHYDMTKLGQLSFKFKNYSKLDRKLLLMTGW